MVCLKVDEIYLYTPHHNTEFQNISCLKKKQNKTELSTITLMFLFSQGSLEGLGWILVFS